MQVQLFDMYGRRVWQQEVSTNQLYLSVDTFSEGIYFLVINEQIGKQLVIHK